MLLGFVPFAQPQDASAWQVPGTKGSFWSDVRHGSGGLPVPRCPGGVVVAV